jgi:general secretion pathway protein A
LGSKLKQPELRQLAQRVSLKRYVTPLSEKDTYDYIQHRLAIAGCKNKRIFSSQAKQMVWEYSKGVPRMINILCDNAFLIGYGLQKKRIKGHIIVEAIKDLSCSPFDDTGCDISEIYEAKIQTSATEGKPPLIPKRSRPVVQIAMVACIILSVLIAFGITVSKQKNDESPKSYKIDKNTIPAPPSTLLEPPSRGKTGTNNQISVGSDLTIANTKEEIIEPVNPKSQLESVEIIQQQEQAETKQPGENADIINQKGPSEIVQQQKPAKDAQPVEPAVIFHEKRSIETVQAETMQPQELAATSNTRLVEQVESWKSVSVKRGDIFSKLVADVYGRSTPDRLAFVRARNPHIENVDKIEVGQVIYFPPLTEKD